MVLSIQRPLTRRGVVRGLAVTAAAGAGSGIFAPYLSRANDRAALTHGLQSGDISASSGVVWARADRPSRLNFEVARSENFKEILHKVWVDALPETDLTAKVAIDGLPAGQDIFYRVTPQNHAEPNILGETLVGRFRTAPISGACRSFGQAIPAGKAGVLMRPAVA